MMLCTQNLPRIYLLVERARASPPVLQDESLTVKEGMGAILDINMRCSTFSQKERQIVFNLKEGVK